MFFQVRLTKQQRHSESGARCSAECLSAPALSSKSTRNGDYFDVVLCYLMLQRRILVCIGAILWWSKAAAFVKVLAERVII